MKTLTALLMILLAAVSASAQGSRQQYAANEKPTEIDAYFPNGTGFVVYGASNTYYVGAEKGGHMRSILLTDAPDKSSDRVQIIAESITNGSMKVKDSAGQALMEKTLDGKSNFLMLDQIKPDVFFVSIVSSGQELKSYKIIRKK